MLVKHNLSTTLRLSDSKIRTWKSGKYVVANGIVEAKTNTNDNFCIICDIDAGQKITGVLSFNVKLYNNSKISTRDSYGRDLNEFDKPGIYKVKWEPKTSRSFNIECYCNEIVKFNIDNIVLNKGEELSEVYLPNINTLPTNKQPLLPPEGNYKEIQPL